MLYDVAVIGAGPAGSTAARSCALRGMKTLLIDKYAFPRPKTCGGGITTAALNVLGLPFASQPGVNHIHRLNSSFGEKTTVIKHSRTFMVIAERAQFDNFLAVKAVESGVMFCQQTSLTALEKENGVFLIRTNHGLYRAKAVIGADGVYSPTARMAGLRKTNQQAGLCLSVDVPWAGRQHRGDTISIFYNLFPQGYGWIFPKGERLSIGSGCLSGSYEVIKSGLEKLANSAGLEVPRPIKGYHIPATGQCRDFVGNGVLLAGDAAGFVDPFTGEGIKYAIISGTLAAETVWECIRNNRPLTQQNLAGYIEKCRQAFLSDFRYSFYLTRIFFTFPAFMHHLLFDEERVYASFLQVLEGRKSYRKMIRELSTILPISYLKRLPMLFSRNDQIRG